jgi:DNA-binding transcriptional MocR family regulator
MDSAALFARRVRDSAMPDHGLRRIGQPGMIQFGGGLPDPLTHPSRDLSQLLQDVLADPAERWALGYGYEQGDAGLCAIVAERHGAGLGAENVVVTNGSAGGIGLVATALLDPGDVVLTEAATYPGALKAFRQMGAQVAPVPIDDEGLDPAGMADALASLARDGRRAKLLYTIASCQNPTATTLPLARRRQVLDIAASHGLLVVEDATYADIRFDPAPPSFLALDPRRVIHLGSFSKTIAPGLRMGWTAAPAEIASALAQVRTDLGTSPLLQRVVARYIGEDHFAPHLADITAHYRRKHDVMLAALGRHCGEVAEWQAPSGGFFVWLTLKHGDVRAALDTAEAENVSFIPGGYFAVEPGTLDRHLRLSYGEVAEGAIDEGVARLARALARSAA